MCHILLYIATADIAAQRQKHRELQRKKALLYQQQIEAQRKAKEDELKAKIQFYKTAEVKNKAIEKMANLTEKHMFFHLVTFLIFIFVIQEKQEKIKVFLFQK